MFEVKVGKVIISDVLAMCKDEKNKFENVDLNSFTNEDISKITTDVLEDKSLFLKVMSEIESDKISESTLNMLYKLIESTLNNLVDSKEEYIYVKDRYINLNKKNLSDKELGLIAWDYVSNKTGEYENVDVELFEDDDFIEIWKKICTSDLKDEVKLSILDRQRDVDYELSQNIWSLIVEKVDDVVCNSLKYYYYGEGVWMKLRDLGEMVWDNIIKHDKKYLSVSRLISEEDNFYDMLENFAENIPENAGRQEGKHYLYDEINHYLKKGVTPFVELKRGRPEMILSVMNVFEKSFKEFMGGKFKIVDSVYVSKELLIGEDSASSLEIKYTTNISISSIIDFNGYTYCKVSLYVPFMDYNGEIHMAKEVSFKFNKSLNKYVLRDSKIFKLIGITEDDLTSQVNKLIEDYRNIRNEVTC